MSDVEATPALPEKSLIRLRGEGSRCWDRRGKLSVPDDSAKQPRTWLYPNTRCPSSGEGRLFLACAQSEAIIGLP